MINTHTTLLDQLTESEYWLLVHITKRLGKNMFCWPSNETLMKDTGWSIDKLRDTKIELQKKNMIEVEILFGKSNRYHVKTDLIGVYVGADQLSSDPLGKNIGVGKNQHTPPRKNQHTTPSEKPTPKYYSSEVLNNNYLPEGENQILQFGKYEPTKHFITIQPKHIGKTPCRINGADGLNEYMQANMSMLNYPEWAAKFMLEKNGHPFNDLAHLRNTYSKFVDAQFK